MHVWVAAECMGTWCWVAAAATMLSHAVRSKQWYLNAAETKTCAAVDRAATTSIVVARRSGTHQTQRHKNGWIDPRETQVLAHHCLQTFFMPLS